jgi:hypothetical protein
MYWDSESYKKDRGLGARAVCVNTSTGTRLKYETASHLTLSISHVWSHGQGGRPENDGSGMNKCLHERYVTISKDLTCNTYWMDTPCIPEDHDLRQEAIQNINTVFHKSRATLVCDRNIMAIDVGDLNLAKKESILATVSPP